jgi:hypothetical protein
MATASKNVKVGPPRDGCILLSGPGANKVPKRIISMTRWKVSIIGVAVALSSFLNASGQSKDFSSLPSAAQSSISESLGRDNSAYHVRACRQGFEAKNPRHHLLANFSSAGAFIRVGAARWQLSLHAYGRGHVLKPVEAISPVASSNRIEYRRGVVTEWYVNGPFGLEQGFTINDPPSRLSHHPLTLALRFGDGVTATIDKHATSATLRAHATNFEFRYAGLTATDADGKELSASLQRRGRLLLIKVDEAGARYPIVIDPWVQIAEMHLNSSFVRLGTNLAVSGNTLLSASEPKYQPRAYVLTPKNGSWNNPRIVKLSPSKTQKRNFFGYSVSISADTVVVGDPDYGDYQGIAYVFVKPKGRWRDMTETAILTPTGAPDNIQFGSSVFVAGDTIAVGAPQPGAQAGLAVFIFVKPPTGWRNMNESAKLSGSNFTASAGLGQSVWIDGPTLVAGAYEATVNGQAGVGAAYLYFEPTGGWKNATENAILTPSDGIPGSLFGEAVTASGKTIVIGSGGWSGNGISSSGAAYLFVEPASGWKSTSENARLMPSDPCGNCYFGETLSMLKNTVVIGGPANNNSIGAVYAFEKPRNSWKNMTETVKVTPSDGQQRDFFGTSVVLTPSGLFVGSPLHHIPQDRKGAIYVFENQ